MIYKKNYLYIQIDQDNDSLVWLFESKTKVI